jgi:plastocyanin
MQSLHPLSRSLAFAAVLGALAVSPALAGETLVKVGHNKIEPAEVSLQAGDTVVFHNLDEMPGGHSVVADDGSFQSPALAKDEKWTHAFEKPGSYGIHLKEHPAAKGIIEVK